jgi:uncharacterized paraquat-inducible protein A
MHENVLGWTMKRRQSPVREPSVAITHLRRKHYIMSDDMTGFILLPFLAVIPAVIAYKRGLSPWAFYFFGVVLLIVAIPVAIFISKDQEVLNRRVEKKAAQNGLKKCEECLAFIPSDARRCQHCGCEVKVGSDKADHEAYAKLRALIDHEAAKRSMSI